MWQKKKIFRKNCFCPKLFLRTPKMLFWQLSLNIATKRKKHFCSSFDIDKIFIFSRERRLKSKGFRGHVECKFDNTAKKFSIRGRIFFAQCPKVLKRTHFFSKKMFLHKSFYGHVEWRFESSAWIKPQNVENFFAQVSIMLTTIFLGENIIKNFTWTRRMQFWQTCQKKINERLKIFWSMS